MIYVCPKKKPNTGWPGVALNLNQGKNQNWGCGGSRGSCICLAPGPIEFEYINVVGGLLVQEGFN